MKRHQPHQSNRFRGGWFTALLSVLVMVPLAAGAATFQDVPANDPYYAAIESMKNLGVVKGYADGTFRPEQAVNRAEALKMVLLAAQQKVSAGLYQTDFSDVTLSDWFSGYVFVGQNLKIVNGNPDGTFAPARQVNKAEFMKMAAKAFEVDLAPYLSLSTPIAKDMPGTSDWFVPYFAYGKAKNILVPSIQNTLEPAKLLSRAECAEILYKMYILKNGGTTQELLSAAEAKLVDSVIKIGNNLLNEAQTAAHEASFYTASALQNEPDSSVVQGANFVSLGFEKIYEAMTAQKNNDLATAKSLVTQAKNYADQAEAKDSSLKTATAKIRELAVFLEKALNG